MWNTERAILSFAVVWRRGPRVPMAILAKVVRTAPEESLRAAKVALPRNVLVAVLLAVELASANLFDGTSLAQELILARRLRKLQVPLTVRQAAIKRQLAPEALVEGTLCQDILFRLVVEAVTFLTDWLHVDLAFGLVFLGERQDPIFDLQKLAQIGIELRALLEAPDWRFAGRARHEVKRDAQGAPPVAEQVAHALGVENVPAPELDSRIGTQFTREANVAQVVLCSTNVLLTARLEARQAFSFMGDAATGMTTGLVSSLAGSDL